MTTTQTPDYAADYLAARLQVRAAADLTTRFAAEKDAARIARKAARAGVTLDEIGLDETARKHILAAR